MRFLAFWAYEENIFDGAEIEKLQAKNPLTGKLPPKNYFVKEVEPLVMGK